MKRFNHLAEYLSSFSLYKSEKVCRVYVGSKKF